MDLSIRDDYCNGQNWNRSPPLSFFFFFRILTMRQLKMNMFIKFQSETAITAPQTRQLTLHGEKGMDKRMVVLAWRRQTWWYRKKGRREKEGRDCHWSEEGGGCFCSAWQVELRNAAGWLAHMSLLLPQAQLWGAGEYGGMLCIVVWMWKERESVRERDYMSLWER